MTESAVEAGSDAGEGAGVLYLVATPIGNLEDMTYRAVRVLGQVDVLAAEDTRSAQRLCRHFSIRVPRLVSLFTGNEARRSGELLAQLRAGHRVAVISEAGMPGISDPGERLVRDAVAAGIRIEVIPGPVAAVTALVGSGLSTGRFLFLGFPPRERGRRQQFLGALRGETATIVLYESPERVAATLADLRDAFGSRRPVVLARELTKRFEEMVRGTAGDLAERYAARAPLGECTLVVAGADSGAGQAAAVDIEAELRALLDSGLGPKDAARRLVVHDMDGVVILAVLVGSGATTIPDVMLDTY
ncbi:MAG: 16S rRNA (cytidine(1402)-2'-O)-methyltransferase, partial [Myxococcota bacterium]